MKTARVAINGLGRIGRQFFKLSLDRPELQIVAVNDLGDEENLAYLLKYDSVYGRWNHEVKSQGRTLVIDGREIEFLQEKEPGKLPWRDLNIDVVVESTGFFESYAKARAHLDAGAKRVVITAPAKDEPPSGIEGATVLLGVNEEKFKTCQITSNGSCTTNAASPVIQIMHETVGIEKALLNTVHGYTATQALVDRPSPHDFRRGRAAGVNIVPSTTGAATAVTEAIEELAGKFDGMAMRVPTITGSIADITFIAKRATSKDEINKIFKKAAGETRWQGIMRVTEDPIVSTDIVGDTHAAIIDLPFTEVIGGNLCRVLSWYDNEMGYTNTLVEHVVRMARHI